MRIDIYSDTVCPWCFIGKRRFERALAARPGTRVDVRWRPFQLNPDMPAGGMERQQYLALKFGGNLRARQLYDMIAETGRHEGIEFAFESIARTPSTLDSHRLIRFAAKRGADDELVEALFRGYFLESEDIGDVGVLARLADEVGLDGDEAAAYLASDRDRDLTQAEDLQARRMGIDGVPCFVVDGRYAVVGAQEPEAFLPLFELANSEDVATV